MGETPWGRCVKVSLLLVAVARKRVLLDYVPTCVYIKITAEDMVWMLSMKRYCCSRDAHDLRMTSFGPSIARGEWGGMKTGRCYKLSFIIIIVRTRSCGALPGSRWEFGAA